LDRCQLVVNDEVDDKLEFVGCESKAASPLRSAGALQIPIVQRREDTVLDLLVDYLSEPRNANAVP